VILFPIVEPTSVPPQLPEYTTHEVASFKLPEILKVALSPGQLGALEIDTVGIPGSEQVVPSVILSIPKL